jgi:hypothetical protein
MVVRIRLQSGPPLQRKRGKNSHLALAGGALLAPASLMAYALGFWRMASDMGMAGAFGISGVFSHWQVWIALAVTLHIAASILNRYGRAGEFHLPRILNVRILPLRPRPGASESEPAGRRR